MEGEPVSSDCYPVFWQRGSLRRVWQFLLDIVRRGCIPTVQGTTAVLPTSGVFRVWAGLPHAAGPRWSYERGFGGTCFRVQI